MSPLVGAVARVAVTGRLRLGSYTDPITGFVSQIRIEAAEYRVAGSGGPSAKGQGCSGGPPAAPRRRSRQSCPSTTSGSRPALTGPSGPGKSTLLGVLSWIVRPAVGRVMWGGDDLAALSEQAGDRWRRRRLGLVFQDFHLVPELSALDNVLLPFRFGHLRLPARV